MSIYHLEQDGDADEIGELLSGSESPAVRARAAEALGEVIDEDGPHVETLVEAAVEDPDDDVRATAVDALDGIGDDALDRLLTRMTGLELNAEGGAPVDAIEAALEHEMPEVRMAAANAAGRTEAAGLVPTLLSLFEDEDPRVRIRVVRAAGRIGDERTIEALSSLARGSGPEVRREIATALGEIGGDRALPVLFSLSEDDDQGVRLAAVRSLGTFASPRPIERLVGCFDDDEAEIRRAAVYALVELLSNAPPEESHAMRTKVVDALASSHGESVTTALADLLDESTEAHQRRNATWLLGRVSGGGDAAIDALVGALDDDDEMVRQFAATSLAEIGTSAVEEALLDALDTTFGEGRSMILFTLGKVGTEASRRRLVTLLDEVENEETQEQALSALSRLGGTN